MEQKRKTTDYWSCGSWSQSQSKQIRTIASAFTNCMHRKWKWQSQKGGTETRPWFQMCLNSPGGLEEPGRG